MSKKGETADRILEQLRENEKLSIKELKKKVPSADLDIIDIMKDFGLIELEKGELRITEFGLELKEIK